MPQIDAVICLWKWNPEPDGIMHYRWKLAEAYPVDDDGYAIGPTVNGDDSRHSFDPFVYAGEDQDREFVPGRLVVAVGQFSAPRLVALEPPIRCEWIGPSACDKIMALENWWQFVVMGHRILGESTEAARKIFEGKR